MKNYLDGFYEVLHKNDLRRRKMISLLLVLSLFVTSTVVWCLRGTGITMVNQAFCGIEEHVHTDECYQNVLVCGQEENELHTHSDACYAMQAVCGITEHHHEPECYTDHTLDAYIQPQEEPIEFVELDAASFSGGNEETEIEDDSSVSEEPTEEQADLTEPKPMLLGAVKPPQPAPPTGYNMIDTVDNNADGIKITMFNYGGPAGLETGGSTYDNLLNEGINYYLHPTVGANKDRDTELYFISYSTPDSEIHDNPPHADLNNYSGDYNESSYITGNRPVQGIVKKTLSSEGYPVIAASTRGSDLKILFDETEIANGYKEVYTDVSYLFTLDENGYYTYDSDKNYAYLNINNNNFEVYDHTFYAEANGNPEVDDFGEKRSVGFFPFNYPFKANGDPINTDVHWGNNPYYDHHFGMKLETQFFIPQNHLEGTDDIIFEYSGDDDMWVFIDGKLVLDVGGIHERAAGKINFTGGDNIIDGIPTPYVLTEDELLGDPGPEGKKWIKEPLATVLGADWNSNNGEPHDIKVFYLERGSNFSNLFVNFNLPAVKPVTLSKEIGTGVSKTSKIADNDYFFRLWYEDPNSQTGYSEYQGVYYVNDTKTNTKDTDGLLQLKAGQTITVNFLTPDTEYYIEEVGVDPEVFESITINGAAPIENEPGGLSREQLPKFLPETDADLSWVNNVHEELTKFYVKKVWEDTKTSHDEIRFRIVRTDLTDNDKKAYVTINHTRNFSLNSSNNWTMLFENIATKYYGHEYEYSVEEYGVPDGYVASYPDPTTDANGNTVYSIVNTPADEAGIHVEKVWLDEYGNEMTDPPNEDVTIQLWRKYTEYDTTDTTTLKVTVKDSGGNVIDQWETDKVHLGGTMEFSVDGQNNLAATSITATNCSCSETDGFFDVTGIKQNAEVVITYPAIPSNSILAHSTFTDSNNNPTREKEWSGRSGSATLGYGYNTVYASGHSLKVTNRTANWDGVSYAIDTTKYIPGETYSFLTYARCESTAMPLQLSMQYNDASGTTQYDRISPPESTTAPTTTNGWSILSNPEFKIPLGASNISVYVETGSGTGNFFVDEFVIAKKGTNMKVDPTSGQIVPDYHIYADIKDASMPKDAGTPKDVKFDEVKLTASDDWTYFWDTEDLNQTPGIEYTYYVKEITQLDGFVTTIKGNNVSTNTEDNPITVQNKYNAYALPHTGGSGTARIYLAGVFLLLASLLSGALISKRERRSNIT